VKLYIYPMRISAYNRYCQADPTSCPTPGLGISEHPFAVNVWINATNLQIQLHLRNLYAHLLENHYVVPVVGYDSSLMEIFSRDILAKIQTGASGWEKMVPEKATAIIKERHLFGYKKPGVAVQALC
jgi:hypothetical protein